jgi:putative Holliday junction resolvase
MRLLGIDLGRRRIGIAVAETEPRAISPRRTLDSTGALARDAEAVQRMARDEQVDLIVVGLPLGAEDDRQAQISLRFADILRGLGERVVTIDESLTSREADAVLRERGLKAAARRAVVDAASACLILERHMERRDQHEA